MAHWSLYRHVDGQGNESLAVLEQLTSGSFWYTEAGEPFTVPVPGTNNIVAENIAKPAWGHNDPVVVYVPPSRKITKLAFRNRFTQTEKVSIEIAALDVPSASMQSRGMAAALRSSQVDVTVATFIDLDRADTRAGVQFLESVGLLAAGRAAIILDTPPTEIELWVG
jgi:hypothetical protein